MSLKSIIRRGAGYARRRDCSQFALQTPPTPSGTPQNHWQNPWLQLFWLLFGVAAVLVFLKSRFSDTLPTPISMAVPREVPVQPSGAEAQFELGSRYLEGNAYETALHWFQLAAEKGHSMAQGDLGLMYSNGLGVPQDKRQAIYWFKKSAKQGNATSQYNLSGCLYGLGDISESLYWLRKSADQNYAPAMKWLGYYADGESAEQKREAFQWWRKAADQNDTESLCLLGSCYRKGVHAPRDDAAALKYWRLSALNSFAPAQYHLALACEYGDGREIDLVQAHSWYGLASKVIDATQDQERVAAKLSVSQLDYAHKFAAEMEANMAKFLAGNRGRRIEISQELRDPSRLKRALADVDWHRSNALAQFTQRAEARAIADAEKARQQAARDRIEASVKKAREAREAKEKAPDNSVPAK